MTFGLDRFGLTDMLQCSSALRHLATGAVCMEEAANGVVGYFYDHLLNKAADERALALVRLYKTHPFDDLDAELRAVAQSAAGPQVRLEGVPCLVLLATAGDEPEGNDRRRSRGHQVLPLTSVKAVESSPLICELVRRLGLDIKDVIGADPGLARHVDGPAYGMFYVPDVAGSDHVPAQLEFVRPHGIRSVLGFGGVLPDGSLFAVVLFSKVPIAPDTADGFSSIAIAVKLALLGFADGPIFVSEPPLSPDPDRALRLARSQMAALEQLLDNRGASIMTQSLRLEQALQDAEDRADALRRSQAQLAISEARQTAILNAALDCIVTIDEQSRIVEFNPAAEATFGYQRDHILGQPLTELIIPPEFRDQHRRGLARYLATGEGPILNQRIEMTAVRSDGTQFPVELTVTSVDTNGSALFTGYLRDITRRHRAEAALREASQRTAYIAKTLQRSLLPPLPPSIPGIGIASAYQAAGEGYDVGGDFYDVFQTGKGDWGVVLGDVMGKGPEAAAITALARYTIRAAAIRARRPAAVLSLLNEAVHQQHPEQFCTAVYLRVRLKAEATRISVASGGHLPPLLRTRTGDVIELAASGMLLGPFPDWQGSERGVNLHPGDLLLLYSDGITEARRGKDFFGLDRLTDLLASTGTADAGSVIETIQAAVTAFATTPSDDLVMIALHAG